MANRRITRLFSALEAVNFIEDWSDNNESDESDCESQTTNVINVTPQTSDVINVTPQTSDVINVTPQTTESINVPPKTINVINVTPQTTESVNVTLQTTESINVPPQTTESINVTPQTTDSINVTPQTTESVNVPPQTTESVNVPPQTTDVINVPPQTTDINVTPQTTDINVTPQTTDINVTPQTTESVNVTPHIISAHETDANKGHPFNSPPIVIPKLIPPLTTGDTSALIYSGSEVEPNTLHPPSAASTTDNFMYDLMTNVMDTAAILEALTDVDASDYSCNSSYLEIVNVMVDSTTTNSMITNNPIHNEVADMEVRDILEEIVTPITDINKLVDLCIPKAVLRSTNDCGTNSQNNHDNTYRQDSSSSDSDSTDEYEATVDSSSSDSTDEHEAAEAVPPAPKRRKKANKENWKKNVPKMKRMRGESYVGRYSDKEHGRKEMGPSCQSKSCMRTSLRKCQSVTVEQRCEIFDRFWEMESWHKRKSVVKALVSKVPVKQKKSENSRRSGTFSYALQLSDGSKIPVCKSMFSSTIGIQQRTLGLWLADTDTKKSKDSTVKDKASAKTPKTGKTAPVSEQDDAFVKEWLANLPTVSSHYCRNTPAYRDKKFLYPGTTIAALYKEYTTDATAGNVRVISHAYFAAKFHELKYSVFIPRKDQCDVCVSAKHNNIPTEKHQEHIKAKDEARNAKTSDKDNATETDSVWTMDLQAVLLCPRTQASSLYYKTKLQIHNFTLYNLRTKEAHCYLWDETHGDLKSEMFASLQYHHFVKYLDQNPQVKNIIIWSDGCGYQNRNSTISNMYLHLAMTRQIKISQKYLVAGHTQMECDSMHSTIERKLCIDVFTPRDYAVIMSSARIRPTPYVVTQVMYNQPTKLDFEYLSSIRPGKRAGDATVHDLRWLQYDHDGSVMYGLNFRDELKSLPQRIKLPTQENVVNWIPLYPNRLKIKARKFNDLQSMKPVMPP